MTSHIYRNLNIAIFEQALWPCATTASYLAPLPEGSRHAYTLRVPPAFNLDRADHHTFIRGRAFDAVIHGSALCATGVSAITVACADQPGRDLCGSNFGIATGSGDHRIIRFGMKLTF